MFPGYVGGRSCIFHVTNEPRMHRCSLTAMAPVISFFLARVRSTFSFLHASMKTQNVAQSVHRARCTRSPRRREKKNCKRATRLVFGQRIRYNFFLSSVLSFFFLSLSFRSSFPVSLPQLVPHYTSNRIPSVVVVLINTVRAIRLAYGGRISTIFIGRREFRHTRVYPPPQPSPYCRVVRRIFAPPLHHCPYVSLTLPLPRVANNFQPRRLSLWFFAT